MCSMGGHGLAVSMILAQSLEHELLRLLPGVASHAKQHHECRRGFARTLSLLVHDANNS